ncbi:LOW QUALITY PROTEIN: Cyclic AMP-dependent protein kinase, partial [Phytophthora megakarya]
MTGRKCKVTAASHQSHIGRSLVERFHRTWKDCVSTLTQDERQLDWNMWSNFSVYAYNSARHSRVSLTPNELMKGRRLRVSNEFLRRAEVTKAGDLSTYH